MSPTSALRRAAALALVPIAAALSACSDTPASPLPAPPPAPPPVQTPTSPVTPSSFAKIDSALARGEIDAEAALLQKLYAARGDARLLEKYRDPLVGGAAPVDNRVAPLLRDAAERFATLSPAAREAVAAYFQPPAYAGSAWVRGGAPAAAAGLRGARNVADATPGPGPVPQTGWTYVDAPTVPVRVWTHPEHSKGAVTAAQVIAVLESTVWPKLTATMGRAPVSDAGGQTFLDASGTERRWGDGGSGAFDVYLIDPNALGVAAGGAATLNYPPGCSARPSFMLLGSTFTGGTPLGAAVAHEFFHALQFAFERRVSCTATWDEGTAEWASYYAYPRWGPTPYTKLLARPGDDLDSYPGYDGWLFSAYLEHAHGADLVRAIYAEYANVSLPTEALERALPGGLERHLPEFARHAWNQPETGSSFAAWVGVAATPGEDYQVPRPGGGFDWKSRPVSTRPLALAAGEVVHTWKERGPTSARTRAYLRYAPDSGVRSLVFRNPHVGKRSPSVSVQALVKLRDRGWRVEDWSDRTEVAYCRDDADERVDSVVVIMANTTRSGELGGQPRDFEVEARRTCQASYDVEVRETIAYEKLTDLVWDVRYRATVDSLPPAGSSFDLLGRGTYEGFIRYRVGGDCRFGGGWAKVDVKGAAEADLNFLTYEGERMVAWGFTTLDWTWMFAHKRHAQSAEEREANKARGSRNSGPNFVGMKGSTYARADTNITPASSNDCPDSGKHTRVVAVKITKIR